MRQKPCPPFPGGGEGGFKCWFGEPQSNLHMHPELLYAYRRPPRPPVSTHPTAGGSSNILEIGLIQFEATIDRERSRRRRRWIKKGYQESETCSNLVEPLPYSGIDWAETGFNSPALFNVPSVLLTHRRFDAADLTTAHRTVQAHLQHLSLQHLCPQADYLESIEGRKTFCANSCFIRLNLSLSNTIGP